MQEFFVFISNFFAPAVLIAATILAAGRLWRQRRFRPALVMLGLTAGNALTFIVKELVQRPRPVGALVAETGYSFPSGHTVAAWLFFYVVIYYCTAVLGWKGKKFTQIVVVMALLVTLISMARVYLRVHYMSDVAAGIGIAALWGSLVFGIDRWWAKRKSAKPATI